MKLAIVGSREWDDYLVFKTMVLVIMTTSIREDVTEIVSGGQRGVDTMAERLADELGLKKKVFPAVKKPGGTYTQAAHERNQQIADYCDGGIYCPGPKSKGTWDAKRRISAQGKETWKIEAPK
jgi:hypothetical protein